MGWTIGKAAKTAGKAAKFVARELCMAGLKEVPLVGKAIEMVETVGARREFVAMGDKVRELEGLMTGMERRVRDAAQIEVENVLAGFRTAGLDAAAREKHIRNFRDIQKHGWSPALFQGLLQNSPEWDHLCRNPQDYGQVLGDQDLLNPDWVHVFIDADKTRILQMPAQMFGTVLAGQRVGVAAPPKVVCSQDVWAFAPVEVGEQGSTAAAPGVPPAARPDPRIEAPAGVQRPARVISVPPPPPALPPRGLPSLADALKQRQAHEEAERQEALRREREAQAARQRKLDADYAAHRDALAEQVAAGRFAEAAKTLMAAEALRPPDAELREVRAFLRQRVPQSFPRRTFTNSVGMKFIEIFPGRFLMGSPPDEPGRDNADGIERQHGVTLTQDFWLGMHSVTQAQWRAVMGNNPSHFKGDSRPVEQVSWEDCQQFCRRLSQKEGQSYRLPTEAEWEYACRAGTTTAYYCGATISTNLANYNGVAVPPGAYIGRYRQTTTAVGSFSPNPWGLSDMVGNVLEWCADEYGPYPTGEAVDPIAGGSGPARVARGGSWTSGPGQCRAASRCWFDATLCLFYTGFRVACSHLLFRPA